MPAAGWGRPGLPAGQRRGFTCGADRARGRRAGGRATCRGGAGGRGAAPPPGRRLTYPGPRGSVAATLRQIHQQQRQQERASPRAAPGPRHHRPSGGRRRGSGGTLRPPEAALPGGRPSARRRRRRRVRWPAACPLAGGARGAPGRLCPLPPRQVTRLGHGDARYKAAAGRGRAPLTAARTYGSAAAADCSQWRGGRVVRPALPRPAPPPLPGVRREAQVGPGRSRCCPAARRGASSFLSG